MEQALQKNSVSIEITPYIDSQIRISVDKTDGESTLYNVSLGFFQTKISALNINGPSNLFEEKIASFKGSYGSVFCICFQSREYIVKFVHFK